jgi:TrmH family RNA methyltransferase
MGFMNSNSLLKRSAEVIHSKDNSLFKKLRTLNRDTSGYKQIQELFLEGEHLCSAAHLRSVPIEHLVCTQSYFPLLSKSHANWIGAAKKISVFQDALFKSLSTLASPSEFGFLVKAPVSPALNPMLPSVILDRIQDAGNVGSLLRSAGAFGFKQVIALEGTAGLWSTKVLRSAMGAHFGLQLIEQSSTEELTDLRIPILCACVHEGEDLHKLLQGGGLPTPSAWIFGHEGQGVSAQLKAMAKQLIKINQPGGEESLNVAAAGAICMFASSLA